LAPRIAAAALASQTEKFYDLLGTGAFAVLAGGSLALSPGPMSARKVHTVAYGARRFALLYGAVRTVVVRKAWHAHERAQSMRVFYRERVTWTRHGQLSHIARSLLSCLVLFLVNPALKCLPTRHSSIPFAPTSSP
jgi:hypothetical protein